MSLFSIFSISGSGVSAQSVRLNTIASNIANANNKTSDPNTVYKAKQPIFATIMNRFGENKGSNGVQVVDIVEDNKAPKKLYEPGNPLADKQGYVYQTNVNPVEQMANMMSASRTYQNNIEVMNTAKQLILATLRLGQ